MKTSFIRSFTILALSLLVLSCIRSFKTNNKVFVVSKDGNGNFTSIQKAIDAVKDGSNVKTIIFVKNGIYKEKITIQETKGPIVLEGEKAKNTLISFGDYGSKIKPDGKIMGTTGSSTFFINSSNFTAKNISFENSAGLVGQAVAVLSSGDKIVFINCRFLGNQDTLYLKGTQDLVDKTKPTRNYFKNCYIEGTTDYIFGAGTAVFENCTIYSKENASYITAASTPQETNYGFVFIRSKILGKAKENSVYLGRPWRPFAKTVYINCSIDSTIKKEGWHNWSKPDAEKTTFYAEYNTKGAGANPSKRVYWSHQLTKDQAKKYTAENILKGKDNWNFSKSFK